jgi:Helix-turn-helix domain
MARLAPATGGRCTFESTIALSHSSSADAFITSGGSIALTRLAARVRCATRNLGTTTTATNTLEGFFSKSEARTGQPLNDGLHRGARRRCRRAQDLPGLYRMQIGQQTANAQPIFLSAQEAAALLRISPVTLGRWRIEGRGPPFRKFGRRVVYAREELIAWAEAQRRESTSTTSK